MTIVPTLVKIHVNTIRVSKVEGTYQTLQNYEKLTHSNNSFASDIL